MLLASAALDHVHTNIIKDRLGGAVVAPLLLPDELATLMRGEEPLEKARVQFIRSILAGLSNPIDTRSVAGKNGQSTQGFREALKRDRVADRELYRFTAEIIRATRPSGGGFDRGLIFEPVQERAERGAELLQEYLGRGLNAHDDATRTAWYVHSGLKTAEGSRRLQWLRTLGDFNKTAERDKYLASVSQLLEGIDVPEVNLIVVMRNFQSLMAMLQLLGRGARIDAFKVSSRLIDMPGLVMAWLEAAGVLWIRASSPRISTVDHWGAPPINSLPLRERPAPAPLPPLQLGVRPINLEPVLHDERKRVAAWRNVTPEDLVLATDAADGVLTLLRRAPDETKELNRVNFREWFGYFHAQFPEDVRTTWGPQWAQLQLDDRAVQPALMTPDQRKTAVRAFRLLGRMFNGLAEPRVRLGLAHLEPQEELRRAGFARVRLALTPRPLTILDAQIPSHLSALHFGAANFEHLGEVRAMLDEDMLFSGSSADLRHAIVAHAAQSSARDALYLVNLIFEERSALKKTLGAYFGQLSAHVRQIKDPFKGEVAATYALALLMNVAIRELAIESEQPWDLHALVGRENGHDVLVEGVNAAPTYYDVLMTLDLVDSRHGGGALPIVEKSAAAVIPQVNEAPTPAPTVTALSRLGGLSGTLKLIRDRFGKKAIDNPELFVRQLIARFPIEPGGTSITTVIEDQPLLKTDERLALALRAAEKHFNALPPRARLGSPQFEESDSFVYKGYAQLESMTRVDHLISPYEFLWVDNFNANFPFVAARDEEVDGLLSEIDRGTLFSDPSLKSFARSKINELRGVSEPVVVLDVLFKIIQKMPVRQQFPDRQRLASLVTKLRRENTQARVLRASAVLHIAWAMNALIRATQASHQPWSLAAAFKLNDPTSPLVIEPGTRGEMRVIEVFSTLGQLEPAITPSAGVEKVMPKFSTGALERLVSPAGPVNYIRKNYGAEHLKQPEAWVSSLLSQITQMPGAQKPIPHVDVHPDEPSQIRLARSLMLAETYYNTLDPRTRLGLPLFGTEQSFEMIQFFRLVALATPEQLWYPAPVLLVDSVNQNLPFIPATDLEINSLPNTFEWKQVFRDPQYEEIAKNLNEFRGLTEIDEVAGNFFALVARTKVGQQLPTPDLLRTLRTALAKNSADEKQLRANLILQMAWIMNKLIRDSGLPEKPWSLASVFSTNDANVAPEAGLRTEMRVIDLIKTLGRLENAFHLKMLAAVKSDAPRDEKHPTIDNWMNVSETDIELFRAPTGVLTAIKDEVGANRSLSWRKMVENRRTFSPTFEAKWAPVLASHQLPKNVNPSSLSRPIIVSLIQSLRLLGAMVNDLDVVDRKGIAPFERDDLLHYSSLVAINSILERDLSKLFTKSISELNASWGRVSIGPASAVDVNMWIKRLDLRALIAGGSTSRFEGWILNGMPTLPGDEFLGVIRELIEQNANLRRLVSPKILAELKAAQRPFKLVSVLHQKSDFTHQLIAPLMNHLIREMRMTNEKPWDINQQFDREVAAADRPLMDLEPTYGDIMRILTRATMPRVPEDLARAKIIPEQLYVLSQNSGGGFMEFLNRALDTNGLKPKELSLERVLGPFLKNLSPAIRTKYSAELAEINLPKSPIKFPNTPAGVLNDAIRGMLRIEQLFNKMTEIERLGLAKLKPNDILMATGLKHFLRVSTFAISDQAYSDVASPNLASRLMTDRTVSLDPSISPALAERFAGCTNAVETFAVLVDALLHDPRLEQRFMEQELRILTQARATLLAKPVSDKSTGPAALLMAEAVNILIRDLEMADFKPWNINEASGITVEVGEMNRLNLSPTLNDLLLVLTRAQASADQTR